MSNVIPFPARTSRPAEVLDGVDGRIGEIVERTQQLARQQLGRPLSSQLALKLARRIAAAPPLQADAQHVR